MNVAFLHKISSSVLKWNVYILNYLGMKNMEKSGNDKASWKY